MHIASTEENKLEQPAEVIVAPPRIPCDSSTIIMDFPKELPTKKLDLLHKHYKYSLKNLITQKISKKNSIFQTKNKSEPPKRQRIIHNLPQFPPNRKHPNEQLNMFMENIQSMTEILEKMEGEKEDNINNNNNNNIYPALTENLLVDLLPQNGDTDIAPKIPLNMDEKLEVYSSNTELFTQDTEELITPRTYIETTDKNTNNTNNTTTTTNNNNNISEEDNVILTLTPPKLGRCSSLPMYSPVVEIEEPVLTLERSRKSRKTEKTLILDLDETLIHAMSDEEREYYEINGKEKGKDNVYFTSQNLELFYIRPGLFQFLRFANKYFECILFTAAESTYTYRILAMIDPKRVYFDHILSREQCSGVFKGGERVGFIKGIDRLNRDPEDVIVIDDNSTNWMYNYMNLLLIKGYYGDKGDQELVKMMRVLDKLSFVHDVRKILRWQDVKSVEKGI